MPRAAVRETDPGYDWPKGTVDAPDAYYTAAQVRLVGTTVTIRDQSDTIRATYELDAPIVPRSGILVGLVGGFPFTVAHGCNCNKPFVYRPKGADEPSFDESES